MKYLLIILLFSFSFCEGQNTVQFGASRPSDTSQTKGSIKIGQKIIIPLYSHSDSSSNYMKVDATGNIYLSDVEGTGTGSVTHVGVNTANGFNGAVLNPTSTPQITIGTTVTANVLKASGGALVTAISGVDYQPAGRYIDSTTLADSTAKINHRIDTLHTNGGITISQVDSAAKHVTHDTATLLKIQLTDSVILRELLANKVQNLNSPNANTYISTAGLNTLIGILTDSSQQKLNSRDFIDSLAANCIENPSTSQTGKPYSSAATDSKLIAGYAPYIGALNNVDLGGNNLIAAAIIGSGVNITNLNASNLTSGTVSASRLGISLTTTGTSGAATYNSGTGIFNIPQYAGTIYTAGRYILFNGSTIYVDTVGLNNLSNYFNKTASDARYLQSFTETDPIFGASAAKGITPTDTTHFRFAYNKITLSGTYSSGTLTYARQDGTTWTITGLPTSFTPSGAAGGGLGGTYPNPTVVTNANLTGPITSSGNATSIASQTGTGTTFVMSVSPTLSNPSVGTQGINDSSDKAASTKYVKQFVYYLDTSVPFVSTLTGFTGTPTIVAQYVHMNNANGKQVRVIMNITGTSNSSAQTATLPFNARFGETETVAVINNGSFSVSTATTAIGSNILTINSSANSSTGFTGSGSKGLRASFIYETQ